MSSYSQWRASREKNGSARVTWVCGESRVLVNEVMVAITADIAAVDMEQWWAGKDTERDLWAAVLSIPDGYTRLTVVRDAEKLKDWRPVRTLLDARLQGSYLLFESGDNDFPKDSDGKISAPAHWLRDSTNGQIIRCAPLSPDDAVDWVRMQLLAVTPDQARRLLLRASGDLGEARSVLAKAKLFGGRMTDEAFDLLCDELPGDFPERLILRDLPGAMLAAENIDKDGLARSIGYLASRLSLLSTLHRAHQDNVSRRDVIVKLGVPGFLAQKYNAVASAEYAEQRVNNAWLALSAAEDAHRDGIVDGVAESLVVSWWS